MKKIIKYLLIVLLIFPLYSCKDEQQIDENAINEFGITYKLENELKTLFMKKANLVIIIKNMVILLIHWN